MFYFAGFSCSELPGKYINTLFFAFLLGFLIRVNRLTGAVRGNARRESTVTTCISISIHVRNDSTVQTSAQIEIHIATLDCPALTLTAASLGHDAGKKLGKWEIKSEGAE